MHITQISEHFFKIDNVLSGSLLNTLQDQFKDRANWATLNDAEFKIREECNIPIHSLLAKQIHKELGPLLEHCKTTLYPNAPQLWFDNTGYLSNIHKDHSINLTVNVQIYLTNGQDDIGTHCYDNDSWYSVPYKENCGYMLIGPTQILHGMKTPTVGQRLSLYQSYRSTLVPVNDW